MRFLVSVGSVSYGRELSESEKGLTWNGLNGMVGMGAV